VTETMSATLASFVCAAYSPKASTSRPSPNSDGISSASIWQKVTSYPLPWSSETTCPASPYSSQSVGTGQHCSPGSSCRMANHKESDGQLKPTMTDALPAQQAVIEMVICHCKTNCSSARCSCTDLCQCSSDCENDEDTLQV